MRERQREEMESPVRSPEVRREKIMPLPFMRCLVCEKLLEEVFTFSFCLHSFCRKCIYEKLSELGVNNCPICDINLGCVLMDTPRPRHYLHDVMANIYPLKRRKLEAREVPYIFSPPPMKKKISLSCLMNKPRASMQFSSTLRLADEKVGTKRETLAIEWHKCLAMNKRRLEEANSTNLVVCPMNEVDYQPFGNSRASICHFIQSIFPHQLSRGLAKQPHPEIFNWIKYYFANFFAYNRALEECEVFKKNLMGNDVSCLKQYGEMEHQLSIWGYDHNAKLKEQADFYEDQLQKLVQHYEAKFKSLETEAAEKWKKLFFRNKQMEKELEESRRCISVVEEQIKGFTHKLQKDAHRAGMEEGVKRMVRAIYSISPYVNWDRVHIFESTDDEEREALQRAFLEGISSAPPLTRDDDRGRVIMF